MKLHYLLILIISIAMPLEAVNTYNKVKKGFHTFTKCVRGDKDCDRKNVIAARVGVGLCVIGIVTGSFFAVRKFISEKKGDDYHNFLQDCWLWMTGDSLLVKNIKEIMPYLKNPEKNDKNCEILIEQMNKMKNVAKNAKLSDSKCDDAFYRAVCELYDVPSNYSGFMEALSKTYDISFNKTINKYELNK